MTEFYVSNKGEGTVLMCVFHHLLNFILEANGKKPYFMSSLVVQSFKLLFSRTAKKKAKKPTIN